MCDSKCEKKCDKRCEKDAYVASIELEVLVRSLVRQELAVLVKEATDARKMNKPTKGPR